MRSIQGPKFSNSFTRTCCIYLSKARCFYYFPSNSYCKVVQKKNGKSTKRQGKRGTYQWLRRERSIFWTVFGCLIPSKCWGGSWRTRGIGRAQYRRYRSWRWLLFWCNWFLLFSERIFGRGSRRFPWRFLKII